MDIGCYGLWLQDQPMVNWWFGARWFGFLGSPSERDCYERGTPQKSSPRIPKRPSQTTNLPSRKLTYPTLGKGKSSSKWHFFGGYVSSLESTIIWKDVHPMGSAFPGWVKIKATPWPHARRRSLRSTWLCSWSHDTWSDLVTPRHCGHSHFCVLDWKLIKIDGTLRKEVMETK